MSSVVRGSCSLLGLGCLLVLISLSWCCTCSHTILVSPSTMELMMLKSATLYTWPSSGSDAMACSSFSSAFFTPDAVGPGGTERPLFEREAVGRHSLTLFPQSRFLGFCFRSHANVLSTPLHRCLRVVIESQYAALVHRMNHESLPFPAEEALACKKRDCTSN